MFRTEANDIYMTEGDFNVTLPMTVTGTTIASGDSLKVTIKNGNTKLVEVESNNISDNTFNFVLTEEQTNALPVGKYFYSLDWYRNGNFMCCLIEKARYEVTDKA